MSQAMTIGWALLVALTIALTVSAVLGRRQPAARFSPGMDPYDYEQFVAEQLRGLGWDARVTAGSGDQGIDVVAYKFGVKLAIQCKLYAAPVGNKAVQEVYAGKAFAEADHAVVVASNGFTPAAIKLARATRVTLVGHRDLAELDRFAG